MQPTKIRNRGNFSFPFSIRNHSHNSIHNVKVCFDSEDAELVKGINGGKPGALLFGPDGGRGGGGGGVWGTQSTCDLNVLWPTKKWGLRKGRRGGGRA